MSICDSCKNKNCEAPCNAYNELHNIYSKLRNEERSETIKRLRTLLEIRDAEVADDLAELGNKIIARIPELHFINDLDIKVGYVRSFERKTKDGKVIMGDCRKVNKIYGAYIPYDFIITFYEPNIVLLSDNQLKILMWHELKHIDVGDKGFTIRPHDIEDFYSIIDEHGTRWNEFNKEVIDILGGRMERKHW